MPTVRAVTGSAAETACDLLVLGVFKGGIGGPGVAPVLGALGLAAVPTTPEFRGEEGQTLLVGGGTAPACAVLFVGLGRMDAVGAEGLRRAAGTAAVEARRQPAARRVATTLAQVHSRPESVAAVTEGFLLGCHTQAGLKTAPRPDGPEELTVLVPSSLRTAAAQAAARGTAHAEAVVAARELVDLPPDRKRPPELADRIVTLAGERCGVTVRDEAWLQAQGYGGVIAVGRGSSAPPRLVELSHRPADPVERVVLLGKGITFDTGGISLKRGDAMAEMKSDMAGAAVVAATCAALADLAPAVEVVGLVALAENAIGGDAGRPGDVITCHGGRTVEVLDTDAEGRLVLADLLDDAQSREPDAVVDLATLTGSAITALGRYRGALLATDDDLAEALLAAGERAGEPLWRLPLDDDLDRFLDSPIADVANVADLPGGGAITAALFLRRFAGPLAWAHLDIAGPAFLPRELARGHLPAGGTGFGVRTLLSWLEDRAPSGRPP